MITAVAVGPAIDVTYEVDDFVIGDTHRPTAVHRHPGGKALNLARAAAAVGAAVQVVAPLPVGVVTFFAEGLAEDGVGLHPVEVEGELRTCVSVAAARSGLMTEVYEHPTPLATDDRDRLLDVVRQRAGTGWVALSGAVPALDLVDRVLDVAAAAAVDTSGAGLDAALARSPRLVKVNRDEATTWHGEVAPVPALAAALQRRTGGLAVVTDSVRGAFAADGATVLQVVPGAERGAFAQGSGDSFLGGLLAVLDQAGDLDAALRLAAGCAAANAMVPGAGRFDADLARRLADRTLLREVDA